MTTIFKREFDIADVLSVVFDVMLSPRGMDGYRDVVGYIFGDPDISTIGGAMSARSAKDVILDQHKDLRKLRFPNFDGFPADYRLELINEWVAEQKVKFGETLTIKPASVALAISREEQLDYARTQNPNIQMFPIDGDEPGVPKGKPPAPNPRRAGFGS